MLEFRLLGPIEVAADSRPLPLTAAKQKAILALLVLRRGEVVSVDALTDALWGGRPPSTATTALHGYVSQLRRLLESGEPGGAARLRTCAPGYVLELEATEVDAARFEQLATQGREALAGGRPAQAAALLSSALSLWRGPPLAEFTYDGWAANAIERLEEERLAATEDRIEADLQTGRHGELVAELETLTATHPLRERLRGQLMLALYRAGRQAEALAAYQQARATFVDDLGLDPSTELQELNRQILNHDPGLDAPSRGAAAAPKVRVPRPPTPLLGRDRELGELAERLAEPGVRLLTITGPGGMGKTRVAVELARRRAAEYPDGVWFIDLSALREPELVLATVRQTVGGEDGIDRLEEAHALLVLDNYEHVVESADDLAQLLGGGQSLQIVVTSREPLHLAGEHEYPLSPLDEATAVDLFVERARAISPDYVGSGDAEVICRRLDGVPLAIELAAARTRVLSAAQIVARLERALPLLTTGARDLPARQRTLRATIEWSYELLSQEEQRLFARLAVFAGGCTLESAEQVCGADLDVLQALVDKSLLRARGERFVMLETIREYATERLEAAEAGEMRRRHATAFVGLVEAAEEGCRGPDQKVWLAKLEDEQGNVRSALAWLEATAQSNAVLTIASGMRFYWSTHGAWLEGQRWVEPALRATAGERTAERAKGLRAAASFARWLAGLELARAYLEESLSIMRELDDAAELGRVLLQLGVTVGYQGETAESRRLYEEAAVQLEAAGDRGGVVIAIHNLGDLALREGDHERALPLIERSLALYRELGHESGVASSLFNLAFLLFQTGRVDDALAIAHDSLDVSSRIGDASDAVLALSLLGSIAATRGQPEAAATLLAAAEAERARIGFELAGTPELALHERTMDEVRQAGGADSVAAAVAKGASLTLREAIDYAREAASLPVSGRLAHLPG